jgi:hypothetical protein
MMKGKLAALAMMAGLFAAPVDQMARNCSQQLQTAQQDKATNEVMCEIKKEVERLYSRRRAGRRGGNSFRILNQRQRRKLDRQVPQRLRKRGKV